LFDYGRIRICIIKDGSGSWRPKNLDLDPHKKLVPYYSRSSAGSGYLNVVIFHLGGPFESLLDPAPHFEGRLCGFVLVVGTRPAKQGGKKTQSLNFFNNTRHQWVSREV
jgi:hypothetical protein